MKMKKRRYGFFLSFFSKTERGCRDYIYMSFENDVVKSCSQPVSQKRKILLRLLRIAAAGANKTFQKLLT